MRAWLTSFSMEHLYINFSKYNQQLITHSEVNYGVKTLENLQMLAEKDLEAMGLKPLEIRVVLEEIAKKPHIKKGCHFSYSSFSQAKIIGN